MSKIDDENLDSLVEMVEFIKQNKLDLEAIKNSMGVEFNDDRTQMRFKNGVLKPMADREGFEPSVPAKVRTLSRGVVSASSPTCPFWWVVL